MRLNKQSRALLFGFLATQFVTFGARAQSDSNARPKSYRESEKRYYEPYRDPVTAVLPSPQPMDKRYSRIKSPPRPVTNGPERGGSSKVTHLRSAAKALKAAGKIELARQVSKEALIEEKLLQLRKVQGELDELRGTMANEQSIMLNVTIMELDLRKMRELGIAVHNAGEKLSRSISESLAGPTEIEGLLSALQENNLVKVLAEPSLVTVSGRAVTFQSGGEFPIFVPHGPESVAVEFKQFGTRFDCVPTIRNNGRIHLELRPTVSEIDTAHSVKIEGTSVPGLRTRTFDTAVDVEPGQTMILSGMTRQLRPDTSDSAESEETTLLVAVTADLLGPVAQAPKKTQSTRR